MINFDELVGGFADEAYVPDDVIPPLGLVVPARAVHGNDLILEAAAFVDSTAGLPLVVFVDADENDPNIETFGNVGQYQRGMDVLVPPSIEAAMAWEARTIAARLERWAARLDEAGL